MFYNQYTFNSFCKSEPLDLSDFMMKLTEDQKDYLVMIGVKFKASIKEVNPTIHCLKNFVNLYQLTPNHLRGLHVCL